ncbi:CapA family protein [Candidatus Protochlamydia phocaeensis]|uniref:CapA family protein n=1 Tax=Candidatus Protochlamydia phocaeensis TaxID=1414722 RepID=UPI000839005B|nr:CapA family protein [Candidatus Protochlamydia phocaeensis]
MKIAFMGDVMLGRLVNKMLQQASPAYPWGNCLPILQSADLRICNLECVLSNIGRPWSATPKMFHFRSDEKNVLSLQTAGIHLVSLANNHVLDYEEDALLRMLDVLDAHDILHAGAGRNAAEASRPAICHIKGQKIGLIAFTDNEPDWEAQENKPGVFYVPTDRQDRRAQDLFRQIKNMRQEVDFLIISAHWGANWGYEPPKDHSFFAHALIEAGADLVFGHSAHIFRGVESYNNRFILYSVGDFIDDYAVDEVEKNDESFIFILEKEPEQKSKLLLYPTFIQHFQTNLAVSSQREEILAKMQELCEKLGSSLHQVNNQAFLETIPNLK